MSAADLDVLARPAAGAADGALVLIHGHGSNEHDLFGMLDLLDPDRRLLGLTPRGPLALPTGGRHWYRLGGIPTPEPETFLDSVGRLDGFLASLPVPRDRIVLGGFSQGAVMSWAMGLGADRPRPAGIVAISGFLPRVDGYPLDFERARDLPIGVAHGSRDPVIPFEFGREAADVVAAAGADLTRLESPVPHTVDPAWIEPLRGVVAAAVPVRTLEP